MAGERIPRNANYEQVIRDSFAKQGIMRHMGAEVGDVSPGHCEIRLPYSDDLSQQHGFFHGGVVGTIADSAGGYAAFSLMEEGDGTATPCAVMQQTLMRIVGRPDVSG